MPEASFYIICINWYSLHHKILVRVVIDLLVNGGVLVYMLLFRLFALCLQTCFVLQTAYEVTGPTTMMLQHTLSTNYLPSMLLHGNFLGKKKPSLWPGWNLFWPKALFVHYALFILLCHSAFTVASRWPEGAISAARTWSLFEKSSRFWSWGYSSFLGCSTLY